MDDIERLERLNRLRAEGALTDAEFEQQKAHVLAGTMAPASGLSPRVLLGSLVAVILIAIAVALLFFGRDGGEVNHANSLSSNTLSGDGAETLADNSIAAPNAPTAPAASTEDIDTRPKATRSAQWTSSERAMIAEWHWANTRCRGGSGNEAETWAACEERDDDDLSRRLAAANICYGRDGEYGAQHEMHRCGPDSMRFNEPD